MGVYRNYLGKTNTIIKGSDVNTANNPITEMAFGTRVTRFLFSVDLLPLREKWSQKEINENTRHYLSLKSTVEFSQNPYLGEFKQIQVDETSRPTSFDLELHAIPDNQVWDAGNGYDFTLSETRRKEDLDFVKGSSNWTQATSTSPWITPGVVASGTTAIAVQHFDKGDENLYMDVTNYINALLATGTTETTSFVLKYTDFFEQKGGDTEYVTGFFTKHTQTYFEPFIESIFDDVLKDDRQKFFLNKINRLYLYSNVGGLLTNLDELPLCDISGTGSTVTHQSRGIYYTEIDASNQTFTSYKKYFDTWSNLKVNGKSLANVKMSFIPKDEEEYYQVTDEIVLPTRYGLSLSGIKQEERITTGEKRRINVLVRKPYTVAQTDVIDTLDYKLFVKEGTTHNIIIDWSPVSRSNLHNYFTLDTSWLIPNKYYVDIRLKQNGETLLYNDQLSFIISNRRKL